MSRIINNSGHGKFSTLPDKLKYYNHGASFLTFFWAVAHRRWLLATASFAVFIFFCFTLYKCHMPGNKYLDYLYNFCIIGKPVIALALIISIIAGINGNKLAWQNKKWKSAESFQKTQKSWGITGGIVACAFIAFVIILPIIFPYILNFVVFFFLAIMLAG